jgi:hypothetical protein
MLTLATTSPSSSTLSNAPAADATCAIEPHLPAPLNPIFIVHRHHLVLRVTILCRVGNLFCLKLQQI